MDPASQPLFSLNEKHILVTLFEKEMRRSLKQIQVISEFPLGPTYRSHKIPSINLSLPRALKSVLARTYSQQDRLCENGGNYIDGWSLAVMDIKDKKSKLFNVQGCVIIGSKEFNLSINF